MLRTLCVATSSPHSSNSDDTIEISDALPCTDIMTLRSRGSCSNMRKRLPQLHSVDKMVCPQVTESTDCTRLLL